MSHITCTVVSAERHAKYLRELVRIIEGDRQFSVDRCIYPFVGSQCDLLIPIVDGENVNVVVEDTILWRSRHSGCNIVPVALGLDQQQMLKLLQAGAFDFETDPSAGEALLTRLRRAAGAIRAAPLQWINQVDPALSPALRELVGSSPAFVKQLAMLPVIAGCDTRVLILGETGTGKEVYARAIHYTSSRSTRPLVAVNCGAIPAELVESELFGHARGAFSNAFAARPGLVREAEGGTLFLDEIDSMPLSAQVKLLRFLQDMEFRPVGSDATLRADVRVIAASNQDLAGLVERGAFRRDLFFRLHVLAVTLPPLRERTQDICPLALHFMAEFSRQSRRPTMGLTPKALARLQSHAWPGNVRELRHVVERAVLMAEGSVINADDLDLPPADPMPVDDDSFRAAKTRMVDDFERRYIERLLGSCGGNVTHAAQMAKKNRRAFFELIRKHRISPERFRLQADAGER